MAVPPDAPGAQPTVRMSRCRQLEVPAACSRSLALGERLGCCCRALPAPSHDTWAVRTTNAGSSAQSSGWDILRRDFQTRGIVSIFANNHEEDHVPFWKRVEAASAASHREPRLGDRLRNNSGRPSRLNRLLSRGLLSRLREASSLKPQKRPLTPRLVDKLSAVLGSKPTHDTLALAMLMLQLVTVPYTLCFEPDESHAVRAVLWVSDGFFLLSAAALAAGTPRYGRRS